MKKIHRILKTEQYQFIFKKGSLKKLKNCYVYYMPNTLGILRVGIAASKKIGNAPTRNKIKRQIRAIVRPYVTKTQGDFIFVARKEMLNTSFQDLAREIATIFE